MVAGKTGKDWTISRYDGSTSYHLGGKIVSCHVEKKSTVTQQANTNSRMVDQDCTDVYFEITFQMKVQRFADYITTYCMPTAEGTLSSHNLHVDDGTEEKGYTGCYVDKCVVTVNRKGSVLADITVKAAAVEACTVTDLYRSEVPITKSGLSTFTIATVDMSDYWTKLTFGVDNHVEVAGSGTSDAVSDVYPKEATYSGSIDLLKKAGVIYGLDSSATTRSFVFGLTDNQSSPVTTTFTFADTDSESDKFGVEELAIEVENISWKGKSLVIS